MFDEEKDDGPKSKGLAILLAKKAASKKPADEEKTEEFDSSETIVDDIFNAVKDGNKDLFQSALDSYIETKLADRD